MSELSDLLLTGLINHGSLLLGLCLFLAAFGVPLPATMLLLAAGAFARQGVLSGLPAGMAAVTGAVLGDLASYGVGRLAGPRLPARLTDSGGWRQAADLFARRGPWAVFFSRFLLTPIALPINLMAGSTRLGWRRFGVPVITGELIWVALFGGLGAVFAGSWEAISGLAGDFAGVLVAAVVTAFALWKLWSARHREPPAP